MLISVLELLDLLDSEACVVVDCRFNLLETDAGRAAWAEGHIPGAFYAHLDNDLAAPVTPATGRHPLPDPHAFAALLGSWGLTPAHQLFAYDDVGGAIAARLWWLLRWVGHERVALLDGGLPAWLAAEGALDTAEPARASGNYPVAPGSMPVVTTDDVVRQLHEGGMAVVDARDAARFAGEVEPIDPIAGHIPGSLNRPFQRNLGPDGLFRAPNELRQEFAELLSAGGRTAFSCGSGVTACHNVLAHELAGLGAGALYVGSWSEWIREPRRPREPS